MGGTAHPPQSPPCGRRQSSPMRITPPRPCMKGEGRRVYRLRTGYASPGLMRPAMRAHAWGCRRVGAPSPAPSARGALPQPSRFTRRAREEGRTRGGHTERGAVQPERERRIPLHARKGCGQSGAQPGWGSCARMEG
ncbi:hypothetical protein EDB86DRAFT_2832737 [Lactarius hatsudake]|nr:hypothetical protein EDB86DRAFT_2832737 [Lactarius hatsudake]